MNRVFVSVLILGFIPFFTQSQQPSVGDLDSLKREIINLQVDVQNVKLTLSETKRTLRKGIFVATLGYTVTIIGGQLLGVRPELGEALLYTGGAIGIGGTIILVNGFNKLDQFNRNALPPPER
ncbi:hypothetical protein [Ekhidna sp. To15]|uniref:hypothetical protein n=1 Tax=Ekhidna sp. To15 TaxID=3395267 RepID=UPI003F525A5E